MLKTVRLLYSITLATSSSEAGCRQFGRRESWIGINFRYRSILNFDHALRDEWFDIGVTQAVRRYVGNKKLILKGIQVTFFLDLRSVRMLHSRVANLVRKKISEREHVVIAA